MAKVSICVPTYNNVEDVKRLLESIELQTYKDIEVNISDDSTNDEIMTYVSDKSYVNYKKNEKPLGHIFNWNAAINMATGEYIKIMFSDDWFTFEDSLEKFVKMLDGNPQAGFAFCGSRQTILEDDVDKIKRAAGDARESYDRHAPKDYIESLKEDYRYLFESNQVGCPSATMYRRNPDGSITLFDEKSNWASDVFLYLDILKENTTFEYSTEPLICVGMHTNQYTETFDEKDMRIYNDYKYMYEKYDLSKERKYREYFLTKYVIGFGQTYKEAKSAGISKSKYAMACMQDFFMSVNKFLKNRIKKLVIGRKNA